MVHQKYLNIHINGQTQIGVIDLSETASDRSEKLLKALIEPRLKKACEEHFDCEVTVKSITVRYTDAPITATAIIILEQDGSENEELVELDETWIY